MQIPRSSVANSLVPAVSKPDIGGEIPGLDRKVWKKFPVLDVTELSDDVVILRVKITGMEEILQPIPQEIEYTNH